MNYCQIFINLSTEEETQEKFFKMLFLLIPQLQKLNFRQKLLINYEHQKYCLYILNINP